MKNSPITEQPVTPDAVRGHWVERMPSSFQPFLRLARADRPVGTWLLLIPCWWGLALGMANQGDLSSVPIYWGGALWYGLLFAIGAFVMRGAGCVYNDIVDQDIDAKVARTANRPLPSGQVTTKQAWAFLAALCFTGLLVLLQFNKMAIFTGLAAILLVAAYPFMKRITWWPQAWLGLTFNWGILVGYVAVAERFDLAMFLLYGAGVCWTIYYDTIYAHQDKEDDQLIGVRSTALRFGEKTTLALVFFAGLTVILTILSGVFSGMGAFFVGAMALASLHFFIQLKGLNYDDADQCLKVFKSNRNVGLLILGALLIGLL